MICPQCGKSISPSQNKGNATDCPHCNKKLSSTAVPAVDANRYPPGMAPPEAAPTELKSQPPAEVKKTPAEKISQTPKEVPTNKSELLKSLLPSEGTKSVTDASPEDDFFDELLSGSDSSASPQTSQSKPDHSNLQSGMLDSLDSIEAPPAGSTELNLPEFEEPVYTMTTQHGKEVEYSLPTTEEREKFRKKFNLFVMLFAGGILVLVLWALLKFGG